MPSLSCFFHSPGTVWLRSLIDMCREIEIRRLQNENPGSSPARPWYYAGNIKSIPRFRHLSPPERRKKRSILSGATACLLRRSFMAQTRCLSYWDEEIPVSGHSRENPPASPSASFSHSQQGEVNLYFSNLFPSPLEMDSVEVLVPDHYRRTIIPPGQPSNHHKWPFFSGIKHMN